jgi:hypothetical protein
MLMIEEHAYPLLQMATAHVNETTSWYQGAECSLWAYLKGRLV